MKKKYFYVIALTLAIIAITISFFSFKLQPIYKQEYKLFFNVGNKVGFDLRTDFLSYGTLPPEGVATRDILVNNSFPYDVSLNIMAEKSISDFIESSGNPYIIPAGTNASIPITIKVPADTQFGNHTGKVYLIFYKK